MSNVVMGYESELRSYAEVAYEEKCKSWALESDHFPSKIGGKPAWLQLEDLPKPEDLQCGTCKKPMILLCQVYSPDSCFASRTDDTFHRTIFVFICRDPQCCVRNSTNNLKVLRSSLPVYNKFYSWNPPQNRKNKKFSVAKWVNLCVFCGCLATKKCSKCHKASYCSTEHQAIDWKEGHKKRCAKAKKEDRKMSAKLIPTFKITLLPQIDDLKDFFYSDDDDEIEELDTGSHYLALKARLGDEWDGEKHRCDGDETFVKFKDEIVDDEQQILRYELGGEPLWIANNPTPDNIPNCEYCGTPRQYEFQIMPQLLSVLHADHSDLGILVVYTCRKSCCGGQAYKKEFIFRQDVAVNIETVD